MRTVDTVSVIIPTLNRPAALERALRSISVQERLDGIEVDVIVVDNSARGDACSEFARRSAGAIPLRVVWEPCPGVSSARNAGVAAARSRWVAFLDDDEEAAPDWICNMVEVARATGADAVFGTVEARADQAVDIASFAPYFSRHYTHAEGSDITALAAYLGTNNSMFDRALCLDGGPPFDVSLDSTGGEDSLLLKRLVRKGRRFAWAGSAHVVEWVPPRRLSWSYVRKRKFVSGQIRVIVQHKLTPPHWPSIAFWMAVGGIQVCLGGLAMVVSPALKGRTYLKGTMLCAAGLGKLLWMQPFRLKLYGTRLVS